MAPDVISGRYRVKSAIGSGGMGTVWLCTDEILGRDVAVKQVGLLPGESVTDSARAMREARSSATLNHRNVVSVFDVDRGRRRGVDGHGVRALPDAVAARAQAGPAVPRAGRRDRRAGRRRAGRRARPRASCTAT